MKYKKLDDRPTCACGATMVADSGTRWACRECGATQSRLGASTLEHNRHWWRCVNAPDDVAGDAVYSNFFTPGQDYASGVVREVMYNGWTPRGTAFVKPNGERVEV